MRDGTSDEVTPVDVPLTPRLLRLEILIVLAVGLGPSIIAAVVLLIRYAVGGRAAIVKITRLPGHAWVDSLLEIALVLAAGLVVLLVGYVLLRSGESLRDIGLTRDRLGSNLAVGAALALFLLVCAGVVAGLLHAVGIHGISSDNRFLDRWPYEPAQLIESIRTALVEEMIVCGYLLHRLRQLGWSDGRALAASMVVRTSYHVYGGVPLVIFTIAFGFIMGRLFLRTRRLVPIIAAHALYDATLFTAVIAGNAHRLH